LLHRSQGRDAHVTLQWSVQDHSMNILRIRLARLLFAASCACITCLVGCYPGLGVGRTGEYRVPRARTREIKTLDLNAASLPRTPETAPATRGAVAQSTQPTTEPATQPVREVILSLADVRRLALENNLDLRVELLNPKIARQSLSAEQAKFEAVFTSQLNYAKTDSAVASQLVGSQSEIWQWNSGIRIPLPIGGNISLNVPFARSETDNVFTFLNPAFAANPNVAITVPLLRGFGIDYNVNSIRVAFYSYQSTLATTKLQVIRVLADAERVYWRLYAAQLNLTLKKAQYELAKAQLDRAKRQLAQQLVVEIDVLRAESGVADTFDQIITAENQYRDRLRELKRTLNTPGLDVGGTAIIIPADQPRAVAFSLDPKKLVEQAMNDRMELLETELRIATENLNINLARNDMLPLVTLNYTYGINGLGPTFDDALSQVRHYNFQDHTASLQIEVPIGNEAARSRYRRSILTRNQQLATKEQRQLQIKQEVYGAVDTLETNWQHILAARKRVEVAARVAEGEQRQYYLGRRTSTEVLDAQAKLADARQAEIVAVAEYQISQVDIAFATGTLLGQQHVVWEPTVRPDGERIK
jgi:outer membrane protein TolC